MNILPALAHQLTQHKWKHTTHNNHPTIETITHQNGTTTHIQITQNDNTLTTQHTTHNTNPKSGTYAEIYTNYTQTHTTISLLDPNFLQKTQQAIEK